jgi:hypothetical protein
MVRNSVLIGALLMSSAALLAPVSGCASTEDKRVEARHTAKTFRESLADRPKQIDATMSSLYEVTSGATTNRGASYREFSEQVAYLQGDAQHVAKHADTARTDADKFFQQWARDAVKAAPDKREQMEGAMAGRTTNYQTALSYLDNGRDRYRALMTDLNDIKRTLDANLSAYSSDAVRGKVGDAQLKAFELKNYIARLSEQIDSTLAMK